MVNRSSSYLAFLGVSLASLLATSSSCTKGGPDLGLTTTKAPKALHYPLIAPLPIGEPVDIQPTIEGGQPTSWEITPELPDGLTISGTGHITGTPAKTASPDGFTVRAHNVIGSVEVKIEIAVLPEDVRGLAQNYWVELVEDELELPVKMSFAADGRLLFGELRSGRIRAIDARGELLEAPVATLPVGQGPQAGLLGIALAPDHAVSREIYVYTVGTDDIGRIWKVTEADDSSKETPVPVLVVNNIPTGLINNGGDLEFGPDGKLWLSVGDCGTEARAQKDGDLAGRILRFERDGRIPIDNPISGQPEWSRGLRNPFDMVFNPMTGGLFAIDNGVNTDDELNFVRRGDNFEWPEIPANSKQPQIGIRLAEWSPSIAPTALVWHNGRGADSIAGRDLFVASYLDRTVRRLRMSGANRTDIDEESVFLKFRDTSAGGNVPLGLAIGPKGHLHIATANAIWRIKRQDGDVAPVPTLR